MHEMKVEEHTNELLNRYVHLYDNYLNEPWVVYPETYVDGATRLINMVDLLHTESDSMCTFKELRYKQFVRTYATEVSILDNDTLTYPGGDVCEVKTKAIKYININGRFTTIHSCRTKVIQDAAKRALNGGFVNLDLKSKLLGEVQGSLMARGIITEELEYKDAYSKHRVSWGEYNMLPLRVKQ